MNEESVSQSGKLTITLQGKQGAIGIRKNVYRAIGCPRYVSLRISYKNNTLMFSIPGSVGAVTLAMSKLIIPELGHLVREITK